MTNDPIKLAKKLAELHYTLERDGKRGTRDWLRARGYEDQLGSGQNMSSELLEKAQALLMKHGIK